MVALLKDAIVRWELVVQHETIRVAHAGESNKEYSGFCDRASQPYNDARERHALCFPGRECPAEYQRKLGAGDVAVAVVLARAGEDGHPCTAFRLGEKRCSCVLGYV